MPVVTTAPAEPSPRVRGRKVVQFTTEAQLVEALAVSARVLFPEHDRVEAEVPSRLGIADLVLARTDADRLRHRIASDLDAVLLPGAAQLVGALERIGSFADATLFALAGLDTRYGQRLARQLTASGHLVQRDGCMELAPGLHDPYREVIAIEAKLDDWRRAEAQAQRYRTYADYAFVALPSERAPKVPHEYFIASGIGLISVGASSEILVPAAPAIGIEPGRRVLVSEVLTARLTDPGTPRATLGTTASRYPRRAAGPSAPAPLAS